MSMAASSFRAPDLKGSRFRRSATGTLNAAYYKGLRVRFIKRQALQQLSDAQIKEVITSFHELICEAVCTYPEGITLPAHLGDLYLASCPASKHRRNLNMVASIRAGQPVRHSNLSTDNRLLKIICDDNRRTFSRRQLWSFKPVREFRKLASKAFIEGYTRYRALEHQSLQITQKQSERRSRQRAFRLAKFLETYDELALD